MNKSTENKIKKIIENEGIILSYNERTEESYIGCKKLNKSNFRLNPSYDEFKRKFNNLKEDEILRLLIEYSKNNITEDKRVLEKKERLNENNMDDWEKDMIRDENGFIDKFQKRNMYLFFKNHPAFDNRFKFNDFSKLETYNNELIEPHIITSLSFITEQYIGNNNDSWVAAVSNVLCHENTYNPIISALDKLPPWDGVKRVESYWIDYFGAFDNKLNRSITKKWFYGLFERLFRPGCRFDHMLIVYDEKHGTGKTSAPIVLLEALQEFANNSSEDSGIIPLNDLGFDKDTVQCLNKAWVAYVDELAKFLKDEPEDVKKFITLTTDNARLSYAKLNKNFPRHCVFYGSTNTKEFIKDNTDTYERRFWVIDCEGERHEDKEYWDKKLPFEIRLQIMAEAYQFWKDNPNYSYNELDEEDIESLKEVQRQHTTASKDIILGQKIMTILDFDYSNPDGFNTYYEWANEAKAKWENYKSGIKNTDVLNLTSKEELFFDEKSDEKVQKSDEKVQKNDKKLTKIPIIWVRQFIQEELGRMINDDNYINKLIDFSWQKNKNAHYNDFRGCFVRL